MEHVIIRKFQSCGLAATLSGIRLHEMFHQLTREAQGGILFPGIIDNKIPPGDYSFEYVGFSVLKACPSFLSSNFFDRMFWTTEKRAMNAALSRKQPKQMREIFLKQKRERRRVLCQKQ